MRSRRGRRRRIEEGFATFHSHSRATHDLTLSWSQYNPLSTTRHTGTKSWCGRKTVVGLDIMTPLLKSYVMP